jgi:large subunit ribosomal protein L6e
MAPADKVKKPASKDGKKVKKVGKGFNNPELTSGVLRWSRSTVYRRKRYVRLQQKAKKGAVTKVEKPKVAITVVKKIGGAKNGGERTVLLKKPKAYYPTKALVKKRGPKAFFSQHKRNTRSNLKPGRILILLAGHHAGKRVVLLKVLETGLLLVNGPFYINSCPLRRISQRYVLATSTRIRLGAYKVPAHINDKYFKRDKKKRNRGEGDIFAVKKEKYVPSEQRKQDQVAVDKAVKEAIKQHPEKKTLFKYLKSMFGLKSSQYPHRMKF